MPAYRKWTLDNFSGTLCVDELGHRTLLLATDPVNDLPVAFALVREQRPRAHAPLLAEPQEPGFAPKVVGIDGSNLYPTVLAEVWPEARQQRCVFHVLMSTSIFSMPCGACGNA